LTANRFLQRIQSSGCLLPAGLLGGLWLKGLHPDLPGWNCPLRALTGVPCPTCFLSRATSAALTGDLSGSVHWHAFGPIAAAALLSWSVLSLRERRLLPQVLQKPTLWLVAAAALMTYWLVRLGLTYGLGLREFPGFPIGP
jgi:hypothetical protein